MNTIFSVSTLGYTKERKTKVMVQAVMISSILSLVFALTVGK